MFPIHIDLCILITCLHCMLFLELIVSGFNPVLALKSPTIITSVLLYSVILRNLIYQMYLVYRRYSWSPEEVCINSLF